jgi:hypothetical protein
MNIVNPGTCRICGCTELEPCVFSTDRHDPDATCAWLDAEHTLCTNPLCVGQVPLHELEQMVLEEVF